MSNIQIVQGGAAVNVPVVTTPGPTVNPGAPLFTLTAGAVSVTDQAVPTAGSPVTVGGVYVVSNTGSGTSINGESFPLLSIQALAGATAGTGYVLGQTPGNGGNRGTALFDVAAAPNPQVTVGGAAVAVPMTSAGVAYGKPNTLSPGQFKIVDSTGTALASTASIPAVGSSVTTGNYVVTTTASTVTLGSGVGTVPVLTVQALAGATVQAGDGLDQFYGSGAPAYALFDVTSAVAATKTATGLKQFPAAQAVDRVRLSAVAPHAPHLALSHGATLAAMTALSGLPAPGVDAASATLWHWDVPLAPAVTDTLFEATLASAAGTSDAVRVTDYRTYYMGGEVGGGGAVPATPTGLAGVAGSGQATLSWDAESDPSVTGYALTQSGSPISAAGAALAGGRYSLVVTGLTNGTAYPFRVAAMNAGGLSPYSSPVTVTPGAAAAALSASIVSPADGTTTQGLFPVRVQADGGTGGVAKVELYVSGALVDGLTAPTTAPDLYDVLWDTTPTANGPFTFYAKAYDYASPPNVVTTPVRHVTVANPARLATSLWISDARRPRPGDDVATGLVTCDVIPATDSRTLRQITAGVRQPGGGVTFADFAPIPVNQQFAFTGHSDTYQVAVQQAALQVVSPAAFTGQVRKAVPYTADGKHWLLWTTDGKYWTFDGVSAPVLLLDTATILLSGETLNDVCVFGGRVWSALSGGAAPVTNRLHAFDPAAGDESYSLFVLPSAPTALTTDGASLYAGTAAGRVHALSASGVLKIAAGTPTALPAAVTALFPLALASGNASPGIGAALADGSLWDLDASDATHGARLIFSPPDGTTAAVLGAAAVGAGSAVTDYLGTGAAGNLFARAPGASAYALVYTAPNAIDAAAAYEGTVYFAVSGDARLYGLTIDPAARTLAYGAVADALPGVTGITALFVIPGATPAQDVLFLGCTGTGTTLFGYQAPALQPDAVYGRAVRHIGSEALTFA